MVKTLSAPLPVLLFCCLIYSANMNAQYNLYGQSYQKNVFEFNLGQYAVNEINIGYEHFLSDKKSVELNGGLIYRNDFLIKQADKWSNSKYFYERGFAARLAYRIYRKANEKTGMRNFISVGLNYQYLYYPNEWFLSDKETRKDSVINGVKTNQLIVEEIYQHRFRHRIGVQFLLGKIFPLGNAFAVEVYYGIGLRGILTNRYDIARSETAFGKTDLKILNYQDEQFYFRPTIHAGVKFRIGW